MRRCSAKGALGKGGGVKTQRGGRRGGGGPAEGRAQRRKKTTRCVRGRGYKKERGDLARVNDAGDDCG